ncbi:MAG TPA: InlB B-repeat-containing protein, partial [Oscillospiraceae bacterium]|nr:InlB B-repeat-containing protein [Oscillospiraceae bacterium]
GWDPAIPPTMPSENVTYTAVWSPKLYTMIFQANGGTFPEHGTNFYQVKMPFGSPLVAPLATRPGYDFVGWDPVLPDTVPNKNSVFTAKWKIAKTTVSFNLNGGTGLIPPSQTGDIGSPVTLPPRGDISKNGYNFLGWAPSSTATTPVTSYNFQATDSTLYAVWGLITYTVSFDLNGGSGTTPTSQTGTPGTNVSLPAQGNIQKPGYKFLGWAESSNATVPLNSYQISNSNSTLYAVWELITYTVSFDLNGGSGTTPSSQTGAPGTSVGLPAQGDITKVGYNFLGWAESADATEVLGSYQIGNADSTLYAVWELITYTVSFDLNGGSGTTPSSQTGVPGTAVVLPAQGDISREYFTFLGWAETADATEALAACQIGNANSILYAVWKKIPVTLTPQEGSDTKFGHSSAGDIIFGVAPGTTEEDFLNSYVGVTGHGELRFSENDGRFGTGRKVELVDLDTEEVLESYYIIIFGDVNGDGLVNQDDADLVKATAAFIGDLDLNTPYGFAADLNGDGVIDAFDFNIFKAALKGIRTISQNILVW